MLGVLTRNVWCIDIDINHADGENGFESIKDIPYYDEIVSTGYISQTTASGGKAYHFYKRNGINYGQKIGYLPE